MTVISQRQEEVRGLLCYPFHCKPYHSILSLTFFIILPLLFQPYTLLSQHHHPHHHQRPPFTPTTMLPRLHTPPSPSATPPTPIHQTSNHLPFYNHLNSHCLPCVAECCPPNPDDSTYITDFHICFSPTHSSPSVPSTRFSSL